MLAHPFSAIGARMIQRISSFVAKRFCHASQRIGHIHAQLAAPLAMRAAAWLTVVLLLLAPKVSPADDQADLVAAFDGANAAYQKADYQKATKQFERALALALKLRGENDVDTATILNNVGEMYRMTGKYAQAESLYQRSLKVREAKLGPNHLDVAQTLSNQGSLYVQMGKYTQAEPLLLRSLKIREAKTGTDQLLVA